MLPNVETAYAHILAAGSNGIRRGALGKLMGMKVDAHNSGERMLAIFDSEHFTLKAASELSLMCYQLGKAGRITGRILEEPESPASGHATTLLFAIADGINPDREGHPQWRQMD